MLKCANCGEHFESKGKWGILISPDGDFVCDEKCKKEYEKEIIHFSTVILPDDKKFEAWLNS